MKLCRFGAAGAEKPGLIDAEGCLRDLSGHCRDIDPTVFRPQGLTQLAKIDPDPLPVVTQIPRFGVPFTGMSKFICIGLNYSDHAAEAGLAVPSEPIIFLKANSALCGPNDDTIKPLESTRLDWEVELGVVIGSRASNVAETDALSHVAGYCVVNDVSERAFQMQSSQWDKGKGCDTFGPVGPWLVTADEVGDPQNLEMFLNLNGRRMQTGNTQRMIFTVRQLIAYVSGFMTLYPGDLLITGTPPGVGMGHKPNPIFLTAGDEMHLGIEKLGEQRQRVVAWRHLGDDAV